MLPATRRRDACAAADEAGPHCEERERDTRGAENRECIVDEIRDASQVQDKAEKACERQRVEGKALQDRSETDAFIATPENEENEHRIQLHYRDEGRHRQGGEGQSPLTEKRGRDHNRYGV